LKNGVPNLVDALHHEVLGQNNLASSYDMCPDLGIKITLTLCHPSGIYPRARQAVKILTSRPDKISIPFFKSAGKIPFSPADLKKPKPSIADLIVLESTAFNATSQSSYVG
jgi:hypothetical protein